MAQSKSLSPRKPPDPRAIALGHRLQRLRHRAGLKQKQLAQKLRVHVNTVGGWEHGRTKMFAVDVPSLATALGVTVGALLGESAGRANGHHRSDHDERVDLLRKVGEAMGVDLGEALKPQHATTG